MIYIYIYMYNGNKETVPTYDIVTVEREVVDEIALVDLCTRMEIVIPYAKHQIQNFAF
jgi:hypothetical protein